MRLCSQYSAALRPTVLVAALLLGGCGTDGGDTEPNLVAVPTWELELVHEIGSLDDPDEMLTDPSFTDVIFAEDGSLLIGQPMDAQIRVYDETGAFVRTIGGRGEGPGEVGGINNFGFTPEGDLWVHDTGNFRMTRFALDGTPLGAESWPTAVERKEDVAYLWGLGGLRRSRDGSALATAGYSAPPRNGGQRPDLGPFVVRRMHPDGVLGDTVMSMGKLFDTDAPEGLIAVLPTGMIVAVSDDATRVHWIERSPRGNPDPGLIRIGAIDAATGDTLYIQVLSYDPIPTSAEELKSEYLEARSERVRERIEGQLWVPETYPPVTTAVATSDGPLWLGREEGQDPKTWWAIDPATGSHIGTVHLPVGERIRDQRGDLLVTSYQDEFDVPYLRRYRVLDPGM